MIFDYMIPDGFGNYLRLIIQAASRVAADELAEAETKADQRWQFTIRDATVLDKTGQPIIERSVFDHT